MHRSVAARCAICGQGSSTSVILMVRGVVYENRLCRGHLDELLAGARSAEDLPDAERDLPDPWTGPPYRSRRGKRRRWSI
jgi:hypothetical protein